MSDELTVEYAELTAENNIAERHFKRQHLAWKVPHSPHLKLEFMDLSIALNYMLLVLVPYFIIITIFHVMHYAVDKTGPLKRMIDERDIYLREWNELMNAHYGQYPPKPNYAVN